MYQGFSIKATATHCALLWSNTREERYVCTWVPARDTSGVLYISIDTIAALLSRFLLRISLLLYIYCIYITYIWRFTVVYIYIYMYRTILVFIQIEPLLRTSWQNTNGGLTTQHEEDDIRLQSSPDSLAIYSRIKL